MLILKSQVSHVQNCRQLTLVFGGIYSLKHLKIEWRHHLVVIFTCGFIIMFRYVPQSCLRSALGLKLKRQAKKIHQNAVELNNALPQYAIAEQADAKPVRRNTKGIDSISGF